MMPNGENLVVYKCSRNPVKPSNLNNGKCYKHSPISALNREFIAKSDNKNSSPLYLTPHSRVITTVGVKLSCLFTNLHFTRTLRNGQFENNKVLVYYELKKVR